LKKIVFLAKKEEKKKEKKHERSLKHLLPERDG
jgi:hypothetical protein